MKNQISSGLKTLFLVHFILGLIFGLINLLIPQVFGSLMGWPVTDVTILRVVGAAMLGFAAGSWYSYKAATWEQVRIVVLTELVWPVLGALVWLWGLLFEGIPPLGWTNVVILVGFAIAFWIFYTQHEGAPGSAAPAPLPKPALKAARKAVAKRRRR